MPLIVTLVLVGSFSLVAIGAPRLVGGPLHYIALPIWKLRQFADNTIADLLVTFGEKQKLQDEIELLRLKERSNEISILSAEQYRRENEELKKTLGRDKPDRRILTAVLAAPPISPYDTLVIDVGKNKDIETGMPVLFDDVAIGTVSEVYGKTSVVTLFSSPKERHEVLIGESDTRALAEGTGGGGFVVTLPKGTKVRVGDLVRTPGLFVTIIGTIEEIQSNEADSLERAFIKSPVNVSQVSWLEVSTESPLPEEVLKDE